MADPVYDLEGIPDISKYDFGGIPDAKPSSRSQGAGPGGNVPTSGRASGSGQVQAPAPAYRTRQPNAPPIAPPPKANRWAGLPTVSDLLLSIGQGAITASNLPITAADLVTGGHTSKFLEDYTSYDPQAARDIIGSAKSEGTLAAESEFAGTQGFGNKMSVLGRNPGMMVSAAAEQVPDIAAQYVLGAGLGRAFPKMGPVAKTGMTGGIQSAAALGSDIRTDPSNKSRTLSGGQIGAAVGGGILGSLITAASAKFAKMHGFADVDSLFQGIRNNPNISKNFNAMIRNAVKAASAEAVLEEAPDEMKDQIISNVVAGRPWHSGVGEAAVLAMGTGLLMGGGGQVFSDMAGSGAQPPTPTQPNLPFGPGGGGYTQPNLPTSGPTEPDAPPINLGQPVPSAPIPGSVPLPFNTASTTPEGQVGLPFDLNQPIPPPTPPPTGPTGGGPAPPKANSINVKVGQNQLQAIQEAERNGYQVGGYDEFGNVRMTLRPAPTAPSNFGIPTERLGPADTAISGNRLTELGQQFSQGRTATQPPTNAVSEQGYQDLLGKLGGRQEVAPDEDTPFNLTQEVLPPEAKGAFREAYDKYIKEGMSPAMAETFALQDEKTGSRAASEMLTNPARPGRTIEGSAMGKKTEDLLGRGRKLLGMSNEDILDTVNSKRTRNARDRRDTEPQGDRDIQKQANREYSPKLKAMQAELDGIVEQLMDDPNNKTLRKAWDKLSDEVAKLSAQEDTAGMKRGYFHPKLEQAVLNVDLAVIEANKNILTPTEYQTAIRQLVNRYNKMAEASGAGKHYNLGGKEQAAFDEGVKGFEKLDTSKEPLMSRNVRGDEGDAQAYIDRGATTPLDDDLDAHSNLIESIYPKHVRDKMREDLRDIIEEKDPEKIAKNFNDVKEFFDQAAKAYAESDAKPDEDEYYAVQTRYLTAREMFEVAEDKYKYSTNTQLMGREPQFAKVATGLKTGVNTESAAKEFTNAYQGNLPGIMVREALQNAFDAIKKVGGGKIHFSVNDDSLTISDNGKGMTLDELMTVFKDISSSGKTNDPNSTGGKGIGKASYMLGGAHFAVETVVKEKDGRTMRYSFEGTPEQIQTSYDIEGDEVGELVPTGTTITTQFTFEQRNAKEAAQKVAQQMARDIANFSRDIPGDLTLPAPRSISPIPISKPIPSSKDDTHLGSFQVGDNDVDIYIPNGDPLVYKAEAVLVRILNNGMYQHSMAAALPKEYDTLPYNVIVNVKPKVAEGSTTYPWGPSRETLKNDVADEIRDLVKHVITGPIEAKNKAALTKFWDKLPKFPGMNTLRQALMFDSGSRMTPEEIEIFQNSPVIRDLVDVTDTIINQILELSNMGPEYETIGGKRITTEPDWEDKVQYVGLLFDEAVNGIHIPHPTSKRERSAILINFFNSISRYSPAQAAMDSITTAMHEVAHVGNKTSTSTLKLRDSDLKDPRVGTYLAAYLREIKDQGGLNDAHGMEFVHRMADIWSKYGTRKAMDKVDAITKLLSDPDKPGEYNPEIKRLLSIYQESRGRTATETDILSRTGVQSKSTGAGKGNMAGGNNPTGNGPPSKKRGLTGGVITRMAVRDQGKKERQTMLKSGYVPSGFSNANGDPIWEKKPDEQLNAFNEAWNIPRGMMSVDLPFFTSAAMRQGLPMIGVNARGWAKGWVNAARAYTSEQAAAKVMNELAKAPTMRRGKDPKTGAYTPSYAEKVGLALTDTYSLTRREETIKSRWTEKLPWVAASNRAYTAFLNTTRVSSLERFVKQAQEDSLLHKITGGKFGQAGRDPMTDLVLGEEIADAINVLTGRGKLEVEFTPKGTPLIGQKKYSLDKTSAAKYLVDVFFSPRLVASRLKMMNPNTYISADPFVRKLFIKGMLGAIGTWWSIAALLELNGAEVNKNPNSANFGKVRMGNTRIDPGGGFQQWLVLGSRMRPDYPYFKSPSPLPTPPYGEMLEDPGGNKFTSSTGLEGTTELGRGSDPLTRYDLLHDFARSKAHPSLGLAVDILDKSENKPVYVGDRALQMVTPMMAGDIAEVITTNPMLVPLVIGAGSLGMGAATYEGGKRTPTITPLLDQLGIPATASDLVLD